VAAKSRLVTECGVVDLTCRVSNKQLGISSLMVFFAVLYFVLYCSFVRRSLMQLNSRPANEYKIANVVIRIQVPPPLPTPFRPLPLCH